jgi:hypothetical protein
MLPERDKHGSPPAPGRSEVFTSGFVPELDSQIDAVPDATTGFHAIEAKLFGANALRDRLPLMEVKTDGTAPDLERLARTPCPASLASSTS